MEIKEEEFVLSKANIPTRIVYIGCQGKLSAKEQNVWEQMKIGVILRY